MEEKIDKMMDLLTRNEDQINKVLSEVIKIGQLETQVSKLQEENTVLKKRISEIEMRVNQSEQYSKSRNILLFGLRRKSNEMTEETVEIVKKIFEKARVSPRLVTAHRLGKSINAPIIVQLECGYHARQAINDIKNASVKPKDLGLDGSVDSNATVFVRPHLCDFLYDLLDKANNLKREVGWNYAKPLTSSLTIDIRKDLNSTPYIISDVNDLIELRNNLINSGELKANLSPILPYQHRPRKRVRDSPNNEQRPMKKR